MGGQNSQLVDTLRIRQGEWQYIGQQSNVQLVKNTKSNLIGQLNQIPADLRRSSEKQLEIYNYRRVQDNALVSIYAAEDLKSSSGSMCGNQHNLKIINERMIRRLCELPQLSLGESLYILSESIRGFRHCYNSIGSFEVNDKMIGINEKGFAKVWLNSNFAENHPLNQKPILQITVSPNDTYRRVDQTQMINNIISLVEDKCQQGTFPEDFRSEIYRRKNFADAYLEIERYCMIKNLSIPDRISLNLSNHSPTLALNNANNTISRESLFQIRSPNLIQRPSVNTTESFHQTQIRPFQSNARNDYRIGVPQFQSPDLHLQHPEQSEPNNVSAENKFSKPLDSRNYIANERSPLLSTFNPNFQYSSLNAERFPLKPQEYGSSYIANPSRELSRDYYNVYHRPIETLEPNSAYNYNKY